MFIENILLATGLFEFHSFMEFVVVVASIAAGLVCAIIGWIIFPYTLSVLEALGMSPIQIWLSRLGLSCVSMTIGFFLIRGLLVPDETATHTPAKLAHPATDASPGFNARGNP